MYPPKSPQLEELEERMSRPLESRYGKLRTENSNENSYEDKARTTKPRTYTSISPYRKDANKEKEAKYNQLRLTKNNTAMVI